MRDFSTIAAPLNDLMKKGVSFHWGAAQDQAFHTLIDKLTHAPLLQLPDFGKTFDLECDASGIGIGGVLLQEGKPVPYFSEKLSGPSLIALPDILNDGVGRHFPTAAWGRMKLDCLVVDSVLGGHTAQLLDGVLDGDGRCLKGP
jgi:hypothetical protein